MSRAGGGVVGVQHAYEEPDAIVTIDGPAGTGKSSVAFLLAKRLGLEFLDTGAMYRAAALLALKEKIDPEDGPRLADRVRAVGVRFDWEADPPPPRILLGGVPVDHRIRDEDVANIVSAVAAQPEVREVLIDAQRRIGAAHRRLVSEGRDQGSVVFPDAIVKFYLTAPAAVRAERRVRQLEDRGVQVSEATILAEILERDHRDSTREVGPLVRPVGAVEIDSTNLLRDEVVEKMAGIVQARLEARTRDVAGSAS